MRDKESIDAVSTAMYALHNAKATLELEAEAWVERKLLEYEAEVERAVIDALADDHSVTNVARAYTISGAETPNRNAIYNIIAKHRDQPIELTNYPFKWVAREVTTAAGTKTVHDIFATLSEFGPNEISGDYMWRYDVPTATIEQVLGDHDPYPETTRYYKQVLERWMLANPYPGE